MLSSPGRWYEGESHRLLTELCSNMRSRREPVPGEGAHLRAVREDRVAGWCLVIVSERLIRERLCPIADASAEVCSPTEDCLAGSLAYGSRAHLSMIMRDCATQRLNHSLT